MKGVIQTDTQIDFNEITEGLRHIAFGSNADAVKLLLRSDSLSDRQIKALDTFNIASLKRTGSCVSEIKFFDRLKAIDKLSSLGVSQSGGAGGFLEALIKSAEGIGEDGRADYEED